MGTPSDGDARAKDGRRDTRRQIAAVFLHIIGMPHPPTPHRQTILPLALPTGYARAWVRGTAHGLVPPSPP
jgi:hypothetical protein